MILFCIGNIGIFATLITPFIWSSQTDILYVIMIHMLLGYVMFGIPLVIIGIITLKYYFLWREQILIIKVVLENSPKVADNVLNSIVHIRRSLIALLIAVLTVGFELALKAILLPWIAKDGPACYFIIFVVDFIMPLLFFALALPTLLKIMKGGTSVVWSNPYEDIQDHMEKTGMGNATWENNSPLRTYKSSEFTPIS